MKKLVVLSSLMAAAWAVSCSGDSEEELFAQPECAVPVSLGAEIRPLLESNCAIEACHVAGTGLPDFTVKDNILEYANDIKRRTREGSMPPPYSGITLTEEEINLISCWVDQGKKDN